MKKLLLIILILFSFKSPAQISLCDSIDIYTTIFTDTHYVEFETNFKKSNFPQIFYIQQYVWNVNNCIIGEDSIADFYADTVLIYNIDLKIIWCDTNFCYSCNFYDTLFWSNGIWTLSSKIINTPVIPTFIKDIKDKTQENKMYDLYGREIFKILPNKIYIRNNKKYIKL